MPDINPSIPVAGQPNSSEEPKVVTALTQLVAAVNDVDSAQILDGTIATADIAALAVTDAKVAASTLTDAKLASPNNAVWHTFREQSFILQGPTSAGTYLFARDGTAASSGTAVSSSFALGSLTVPSLTDFTVAGKTAQARVLVHSLTNATSPGVPLSFGFYPISTVAGGAGALTVTLSAAIAGSFVTYTPTASSVQQAAGAAFTLSGGSGVAYMLGVQWATTTLANNSLCSGIIDLQVRFT